MSIISNILIFTGQYASKALAVGVLIGLIIPPLADLFRPIIVPVIYFNMIIVLLRLDFSEILAAARRPLQLGWAFLIILILSPIVMHVILGPLGLPAGLILGLVLMAAAPPINSAPAFALILGLDAAFSVAVVVGTHLLVPLTLPVIALSLLGLELDIEPIELMFRLMAFILSALAIAYALQRWVFDKEKIEAYGVHLNGLAVIGLVIFAIGIMSGVTATAFERPGFVALVIICAFIANASLQAVSAFISWRMGAKRALTLGHMAGNCNMGLVLAVLADKAPHDTVVFFALAQIPMYMLPAIAMPIYRRLTPT